MSDAVKVLASLWFIVMAIGLAFCLAGAKSDGKITIRPVFATFDCWIGVFWDSGKQCWYWFPIPMLGLKIFGRGK